MNVNYRIGGRKGGLGSLGTAGGVFSVVVATLLGSLVAVAGLLVVWVSLVLGAVALFGWWGWQKLRGREPAKHLAGMLMKRAQAHAQQRSRQDDAERGIAQADVVDVEVREVAPDLQRRG